LASAVFSPWQEYVWRGWHTVTGQRTVGRWEGFWAFLCYGLTFFIVARFYIPKRLHFLIFAGGSLLLSLHGVLQFLGFDILHAVGYLDPLNARLLDDPLTRIFRTTLGNVNVVSAYCSLAIILFAALFTGENSKWGIVYAAASAAAFGLLLITRGDAGRVAVLVTMVLLIPYWISDRARLGKILFVLSGWCAVYAAYAGYLSLLKGRLETHEFSRADRWFINTAQTFSPVLMLSAAAVLALSGVCLLIFLKKWPARVMKIAGAGVLAMSIIGGLLFVEIAGRRFENRPSHMLWQAREVMRGRIDDNFGSNRGWVWKNGLSVVFDRPLLGSGPDTFYKALGDERQAEALRITNSDFDKAHNTFLQIAVCMGLPALLAYLVFLGGLFVPAVKKAFGRPILFAFGAAALSFLIQSFFQVDTPIDRPLLYVALGVTAGELWRERIGHVSVF
jgi:hypothetical protein